MENIKYRRILLKFSGEALAGDSGIGIDPHQAVHIAERVKEVREMGVDVAIVIGAGNLWRGRSGLDMGMDRATADYMGMPGYRNECSGINGCTGKSGCCHTGAIGHRDAFCSQNLIYAEGLFAIWRKVAW